MATMENTETCYVPQEAMGHLARRWLLIILAMAVAGMAGDRERQKRLCERQSKNYWLCAEQALAPPAAGGLPSQFDCNSIQIIGVKSL